MMSVKLGDSDVGVAKFCGAAKMPGRTLRAGHLAGYLAGYLAGD